MIKLARTVVLPLALLAALTACDKGKKSGGSGATGAAGAAAIAPPQGGLKRALAAMPADTEVIVGFDIAQLRKSALWKKYEPLFMEKAGKELGELKAKCGFDPLEKLTGVLIGGKGMGGQMEHATVFVRGLERKPTIDCLNKYAADETAKGQPKTVAVDGDIVELTEGTEAPKRFMFIDDTTMLFVAKGQDSADKAGLQAAAAAKDGEGLTASKAFISLLDSTKTGSSMWFLVNASSPSIATATQQLPGMKFDAIFGSVDVGAGVDGEIRFRMKDKDGASSLKTMAEMGMSQAKSVPQAEPLLKGVTLTTADRDMIVKVKFDQAQIDQIVELAKSGPF